VLTFQLYPCLTLFALGDIRALFEHYYRTAFRTAFEVYFIQPGGFHRVFPVKFIFPCPVKLKKLFTDSANYIPITNKKSTSYPACRMLALDAAAG